MCRLIGVRLAYFVNHKGHEGHEEFYCLEACGFVEPESVKPPGLLTLGKLTRLHDPIASARPDQRGKPLKQ
jgi:hypothetical protein